MSKTVTRDIVELGDSKETSKEVWTGSVSLPHSEITVKAISGRIVTVIFSERRGSQIYLRLERDDFEDLIRFLNQIPAGSYRRRQTKT